MMLTTTVETMNGESSTLATSLQSSALFEKTSTRESAVDVQGKVYIIVSYCFDRKSRTRFLCMLQ